MSNVHIGVASFSADRALVNESDDRFGRAQFAKRIAAIVGARTDPSSLVVGLYGPWGDGKTTVLNFIRQSLAKFPLITCITFNPWRFDSEDTLLQGFFSALAAALEVRLSTKAEAVGKMIKDYSALLKLGHSGLSDVASLAGGAMSRTSIESLRDRISNLLSESNVRIVVLVDDIDRMEKSEVQAIFRLIKLSADFENTAYILAFDEEMVAKAVGERYSPLPSEVVSAGRNFLEKIIQVALHLPPAKKGKIREYCFEMLDKAIAELEVDFPQEQVNEFVSLFSRGLEWKIQTPRAAVRYVNAVGFAVGMLNGEVYMPDLLILEGIRLFFPALYDRIRKEPGKFLGRSQERRSLHEDDSIDKLIQDSLQQEGVEQSKIVRRLVEGLFPRAGTVGYGNDWDRVWARNKRIASDQYFDRYFSYSIDETDISDRALSGFLELMKQQAGKVKLADLLNKDNAGVLIAKLRALEEVMEPQLATILIPELVENGRIYPNPASLMSFGQPYAQAAILVAHLFKRLPLSERLPLALDVIRNSDDLAFLVECTRWIYSSKNENHPDRILPTSDEKELSHLLAEKIEKFARTLTPAKWNFLNPYSSKILYAWVHGMDPSRVKMFVEEAVDSGPTQIYNLLRAGLSKSYSASTGLPLHSRFERSSYDHVAGISDVEHLSALLREQLGTETTIENEDDNDEIASTDKELGMSFLRIHDFVVKEKQTSEDDPIGTDSGPERQVGEKEGE